MILECVCHCKVLHDLRPRVLECEGGLSEVLVDKIPQKLTRRMIDFILLVVTLTQTMPLSAIHFLWCIQKDSRTLSSKFLLCGLRASSEIDNAEISCVF